MIWKGKCRASIKLHLTKNYWCVVGAGKLMTLLRSSISKLTGRSAILITSSKEKCLHEWIFIYGWSKIVNVTNPSMLTSKRCRCYVLRKLIHFLSQNGCLQCRQNNKHHPAMSHGYRSLNGDLHWETKIQEN